MTTVRALALLAGLLLVPACGGSTRNGTLNPAVAPGIPPNLSVVPGNAGAMLTWTASPAATTYDLYRSQNSGGPYAPVAGASGVPSTWFHDAGLVNGKTYYYVISACNDFGKSQNSAETSVVPGIFAKVASTGAYHTLALLSDGSLWGWGANSHGELGAGNSQSLSPVGLKTQLSDVVGISAGESHSLAIRSDGTVWSWGDNSNGLLGLGASSVTGSNVPLPAATPSGIVQVSAQATFSLALREDGTVWAWGMNDRGQLGTPPSAIPNPVPTPVPGAVDVVQISAGRQFGLALQSDGTVLSWGANEYAQLGDGTTTDHFAPRTMPQLNDITEVRAGSYHGVALATDGSVWTWGAEGFLSTPTGRSSSLRYAGPVPGLTGVKSIVAGGEYTAGLRFDGTVWIWGSGAMINDTLTPQPVPGALPGLQNIVSMSGASGSLVAIDSAGLLWGCGSNTLGGLGTGGGGIVPFPVQVEGLTWITKLSAGFGPAFAIANDHTLWSWGRGVLGDGNPSGQAPYRVQVLSPPGLEVPVAVACGWQHTFALNATGTVWGWGNGNSGVFVDGDWTDHYVTVPTAIPGLTGVTLLAGGKGSGFAVGAGGTVKSWGNNDLGATGCNSNQLFVFVPTPMPGLSGVTSIAAGESGGVAVAGGQVWAWGSNLKGGLGNGTLDLPEYSLVPVMIDGMTGFTSVAAGYSSFLALKSDGTVWTWGETSYLDYQTTPYQVQGLPPITAIAAGSLSFVALAADGTVWCWGRNDSGQLGNGTFALEDATTPFPPSQVVGLSDVIAIASGSDTGMALRNDLTIWCWGSNGSGELGVGTTGAVREPIIFTR